MPIPKYRDAIVARKAAGANVRVILADPSWIAANTEAGAFLAKNAIDARRMVSPKVHVKSIQVAQHINAVVGRDEHVYNVAAVPRASEYIARRASGTPRRVDVTQRAAHEHGSRRVRR